MALIARITGIVLLVLMNLAVLWGLWEKWFSGDPKADLGLFFGGAICIPLAVVALSMLIPSGWYSWYYALLVLPTCGIAYFVGLLVR